MKLQMIINTLKIQSSLERQVLRENCKRKASGSISIRPIKIIRTELVKDVNSEIEHRDIRSIRKAMFDKFIRRFQNL